MNIEHTDFLRTDGDSYAAYKMLGFNTRAEIAGGNHASDSLEIMNNKPYIYEKHEFLHSFLISDDFSEITFWLKAGFDAADHLEKIELELNRICLNLILYDDLHTFKPVCELVKIKTLRYETRFEECLCIKDELKCAISVKSDNFYSDIAHGDSAMLDKKSRSVYKQIFDIIQCPNLVIQYMALYDLLKDLACRGKKKNQQGVVNFF